MHGARMHGARKPGTRKPGARKPGARMSGARMSGADRLQCNPLARWLGKGVMRICGWRVEGAVPQDRKMIVIAAPHTSNWDFIFLLGAAWSFGLPINWLGKKSLFPPVAGTVLRFLGGVPVDRSTRTNLVDQLARTISESDQFALVIPPSGTRGRTDYWKSGFYRIALKTGIPVVCGYLDYRQRIAGLGLSFTPTGDIASDMDRLRKFYEGVQGKYPENTSRVRLKEEDAPQD